METSTITTSQSLPSAGIKPNSRFELMAPEIGQERIDKFLCQQFPLYSRSFFSRLIEDKVVTINGKPINKAGAIIKPGDAITITFPADQRPGPEEIKQVTANVELLYTHEHFFVLNKPAGLTVHKGSSYDTAPTLVDWLLLHHETMSTVGSIERPGIVHRLDKDTSGIMIIARTNYAHGVFTKLFHDRQIHKTYHALVQGHPSQSGTIELAIGRDTVHRHKMKAYSKLDLARINSHSIKVRNATTDYTVLEYFKDSALVEFKPVTGRTHQIRVHSAAIGHPIIGDSTYGGSNTLIARHALHAQEISFDFDGTPFKFSCVVPQDFDAALKKLSA